MGTLLNRRRCIRDKALPYDAEIKFLESKGTQWINTGINCNSNYILEVEVQGGQGTEGVIGARVSSSSNMHAFVFPGNATQARYSYGSTNLLASVNFSLFNYYRADKDKLYVNGDLVGTASAASFTLNFPYYLFALNTNGRVSNLGAKKIKMCRIWDGDLLLLDLIPVRKGDVGYMYDKVRKRLLGNQGTGNFVVGPNKGAYYYSKIEYLESTGTQWIHTGVLADSNVSVVTDIVASRTEQNITIFGNIGLKSAGYHLTPYNSSWYYGNNSNEAHAGTYTPTVDAEYNIQFNVNGSIVINGEIIGSVTVSPAGSNNFLAISRRLDKYGKWKYKNFKVYNGNVLVRDFIPVRVDNTGYMYDKVSGQLFGNAGTGDFILGPDKTT